MHVHLTPLKEAILNGNIIDDYTGLCKTTETASYYSQYVSHFSEVDGILKQLADCSVPASGK